MPSNYRVHGITVAQRPGGDYGVTLDLNSIKLDAALHLQQQLGKASAAASGGRSSYLAGLGILGGVVGGLESGGAGGGTTLRLRFLVHQDGFGDVTYMYVDDISVTADGGSDLESNGNFETGDLTGWTASAVGGSSAAVSSVQAHSPPYSCFLGNLPSPFEPDGDTYIYQDVIIPAGAATASLHFFYWPYSEDSITSDWQEVDVLDPTSNTVIGVLMKRCDNNQTWVEKTIDLTPYLNRAIGEGCRVSVGASSGTWAPSAGTSQRVPLDVAEVDPGSMFVAANHSISIPAAGLWKVGVYAQYTVTSSSGITISMGTWPSAPPNPYDVSGATDFLGGLYYDTSQLGSGLTGVYRAGLLQAAANDQVGIYVNPNGTTSAYLLVVDVSELG